MNSQRYDEVFANNFNVESSCLDESFTFDAIEQWDSLAHMELMSALEGGFGILLSPDEVLELTSYTKGKEILIRHGVSFEE